MDRALGARPAGAPGASAGQGAALSLGATRIGYGDYTIRQGRLEAHLNVADPRTGKIVAVLSAGGAGGDVLAVGGALARQISPHVNAYPTRSDAALHAYADALEAAVPAEALARAGTAVEEDPAFGPAVRLLAGLMLERGDRTGALDCLNKAMARAAGMPAGEQARLRLDVTTIENQAAAHEEALAAVAAAEPADPEGWMELGSFAFARHDYAAARVAFRKAADLEPTRTTALNEGAYAAVFAGHADEALVELRRYRSLRPSDPNALDSLGDVQLLIGRLREAEGFYVEAAKIDPHFLNGADWLKAAMARLMTGDVTGADGWSEKYLQARFADRDPAADLFRAQWRFLSGRRRQGLREMEAIARRQATGPAQGLAAEAHAQLAIWDLYMGDRSAAQTQARAAVGTVQAAALAAFLTQTPASAPEWRARAERLAPRPEQAEVRDFLLGQAALLERQFGAAVPALRRAYENAAPTNAEVPVLLAWAYMETGQAASAAPLLALNPIPQAGGISVFASCSFPRVFFLRGRLAEWQGHAEAARTNYRLFLELSGDAPFQWGEEQIARALLEK